MIQDENFLKLLLIKVKEHRLKWGLHNRASTNSLSSMFTLSLFLLHLFCARIIMVIVKLVNSPVLTTLEYPIKIRDTVTLWSKEDQNLDEESTHFPDIWCNPQKAEAL